MRAWVVFTGDAYTVAAETGWPDDWLNQSIKHTILRVANQPNLSLLHDYPLADDGRAVGLVGLRAYIPNPEPHWSRPWPRRRPVTDAFLAATAEHLMVRWTVKGEPPAWLNGESRFLHGTGYNDGRTEEEVVSIFERP